MEPLKVWSERIFDLLLKCEYHTENYVLVVTGLTDVMGVYQVFFLVILHVLTHTYVWRCQLKKSKKRQNTRKKLKPRARDTYIANWDD